MPDFGELLKDKHVIFKVLNCIALFYGVKSLIEFNYWKSVIKTIILVLATCGGLISNLVLLYTYVEDDKNQTAEDLILTIYGLFNVLAAYICATRMMDYVGCPSTCYKPLSVMFLTTSFVGVSMTGELFYYHYENASSSSEAEEE